MGQAEVSSRDESLKNVENEGLKRFQIGKASVLLCAEPPQG